MAITINGSGTITGISAGGLPDGSVSTADLADGAVTDAKINGMSSSKLSGALPAIDGSALTGVGGGGKVLQTKFTIPSFGEIETTSTSWGEMNTGWRTAITPVSSTSTMYIWANCLFHTNNDSGNDSAGYLRLNTVGGSGLGTVSYRRNYDRGGSGLLTEENVTMIARHAHGTTSQLTYTVDWKFYQGSWIRAYAGAGYSCLMIMEIEAND